jgi:UDP-glucuronate 4-epimerase
LPIAARWRNLRFFTVYGPWGRPDMAIWLFTAAILQGTPLKLFNDGRVRRDFTYIDDVTEAASRLLMRPPRPDAAGEAGRDSLQAPSLLYNVGNSQPVEVNELVRLIEEAVGRPAVREYLPLQPGDVLETSADCTELERAVGFLPNTPLKEGVRLFVEWFQAFDVARPVPRARV